MPKIALTWDCDGTVDSYEVIRSDTSLESVADDVLPTPIATGITAKNYDDTTVTTGNTYYYKIRSKRGSNSAVSGQIEVLANSDIYWGDVVAYLPLNNSLADLKGNTWAYNNSTLSFSAAGGLELIGGNGNGIICTDSTLLNFGSGAYTVEGFLNLSLTSGSNAILATGSTWYSGAAIIGLEHGVARHVIYGPPVIKNGAAFPVATETHFAFTRDSSGYFRAFFDGVKQLDAYYPTAVNFSNHGGAILFGANMGESSPQGIVSHLRITKGVARYTSNFTVPTAPFPHI